MRRALATLLVWVFGYSLAGPALVGGAEADVPACCRRDGKHHCAMMDMDGDAAGATPSGHRAKAQAAKCPHYPNGGAVPPHGGAALAAAGESKCGAAAPLQAAGPEAEDGRRTLSGRSHQKRGPPTLPVTG